MLHEFYARSGCAASQSFSLTKSDDFDRRTAKQSDAKFPAFPRYRSLAAEGIVQSPRGANCHARSVFSLRPGDVLLDQQRLLLPAFLVRGERFGATCARHTIEAGFGDGEHDAFRIVIELE